MSIEPAAVAPAPIEQARGEEGPRKLFESTAKGMGFVNHAAWDDLAEQTRELYREEFAKRALSAPSLEDARDAARYRWWRTRVSREKVTETSGDLSISFQRWYHVDYTQVLESDHIDEYVDRNLAAIDAARGSINGQMSPFAPPR